MLRDHGESCRGARHLRLFGWPICNKGFCKLIGVGKTRFKTLSTSVKSGAEIAPLDGRYIPSGPRPQSHNRSLVYNVLYNLWLTAGECLPDGAHTSSNKRPRQAKWKTDSKQLDRSQVRHLPPGKFMDYYRLCTVENPGASISRKLFTSVGASTN